jgi:antitoxin MazE
MHVSIQKWGNSLALRIPHLLAKEARLRQGEKAELQFRRGQLVLTPLARPPWTLKTLLSGVKKHHLHGEVKIAGPMGREVW